jgi:hypothetical protein
MLRSLLVVHVNIVEGSANIRSRIMRRNGLPVLVDRGVDWLDPGISVNAATGTAAATASPAATERKRRRIRIDRRVYGWRAMHAISLGHLIRVLCGSG